MRIMRKLVVLAIIGLSVLVVLANAQANEQIRSEKFAGELTESSNGKRIDSVEYAVPADGAAQTAQPGQSTDSAGRSQETGRAVNLPIL